MFRVERDRVAWGAMFEIMRQFWFEHLVPARHALKAEGYTPEVLKRSNLVLPHEPNGRNARGGDFSSSSSSAGGVLGVEGGAELKARAAKVYEIVRQFEPEFKHACAADVENVCKGLSRRAEVLKRTGSVEFTHAPKP